MENLNVEFNVGDVVTFCAYPEQLKQDLKCKVVKIETENDKVFYHISGDALSVTTGESIKESELFKPYKIAFELINKYGLQFNVFKSQRYTETCYCMRFNDTKIELLIRDIARLVELFDENGKTMECIKF